MEMEVSVDDKEIKYTFWHQEDTLNRTELIKSSRMKKKLSGRPSFVALTVDLK